MKKVFAILILSIFVSPVLAPGQLLSYGATMRATAAPAPLGPVLDLEQSPDSARRGERPLETQSKVTAYTLPPDLYQKAKTLSRFHFFFNLGSFAYGLLALWLVLRGKLASKYRNWAEHLSKNRLAQAFVFTPLLTLTIMLLEAPAEIWQHAVSRKYGLSIEGWGALAWDLTKSTLILMVIGSFLAWILYAVIRRSPRRWWFDFWLISIPIIIFLSFVEPFVLEPMFFTFAPLQQKDPSLVVQIERIVQRSGISIPPESMFWMKASDKTPLMNAYVTGIGASKRIVVWDTTIEKETTPEIVSVVGHETGHYVLGHVWQGLGFTMVLLFVLLYLGYRCMGSLLSKSGARWGIRGLDDWASLPALLLVLSIFSFVSDPISNAFSRRIEQQADVFGLEVTHGILPNAGQAAADSFQVEGESALADPDPNPLNVFLFYDHPPISDRVRFCLTYDPWSQGKTPQFVK
jgi:STE24 endopeptidase